MLVQDLLNEMKMLLEAGGQDSGKIELAQTNVEKAFEYTTNLLGNKISNSEWKEFLDTFKTNYTVAKTKTERTGTTQRYDMPVVDTKQVKYLQKRLLSGHLDVIDHTTNREHDDDTFKPFLSGDIATEWLERGIKDGVEKDDIINVVKETISVINLKPIQKQIYFDKSIGNILEYGIEDTKVFLKEEITIISKDGFIIDGHHRWLSAMLINPELEINVLKIDIHKDRLVKLLLAYGDAIGNERNA